MNGLSYWVSHARQAVTTVSWRWIWLLLVLSLLFHNVSCSKCVLTWTRQLEQLSSSRLKTFCISIVTKKVGCYKIWFKFRTGTKSYQILGTKNCYFEIDWKILNDALKQACNSILHGEWRMAVMSDSYVGTFTSLGWQALHSSHTTAIRHEQCTLFLITSRSKIRLSLPLSDAKMADPCRAE